ncbi:MAG: type II secretion system protein [Candidatus Vogelbacteria bacterium]|nr:type II secretion system protein [Candidatus Vogelbacteria bacterium]
MNLLSKSKRQKIKDKREASGFTLIELMVTLAIFVMMTTVVLGNYPKFNNKIALEMLAQNIALSIREAQVFGISIRATELNSSQLAPAYGIHFIGPEYSGFKSRSGQDVRKYILFADENKNDIFWDVTNQYTGTGYDPNVEQCIGSSGEECDQVFTISGQSQIGLICTNLMRDSSPSSTSGSLTINTNPPGASDGNLKTCMANPVTRAEILFVRPNPEANLRAFRQDGAQDSSISDLNIFVHSTNNAAQDRMITVWSTGQISVQSCDSNYNNSNNPNFGNCSVK